MGEIGLAENRKEPKTTHTRTRNGCMTCRRFRKKCSEEKPNCARCEKLGHICQWPDASATAKPRKRKARSAPIASPLTVTLSPTTSSQSPIPITPVLTAEPVRDDHPPLPQWSDLAELLLLPPVTDIATPALTATGGGSSSESTMTSDPLDFSLELPEIDWTQTLADFDTPLVVDRLAQQPPLPSLPAIYDCRQAKTLLELLPAAFIWLNTYYLGNEISHVAGYAAHMAKLFETEPGAVTAAALSSAAAFFSSQRFDLDRSITLEKTTGKAWADLSGLSDWQGSLKEIGAAAKTQFPAIRGSARDQVEHYLHSDAPLGHQMCCMFDMALTDCIVDGTSACNVWLDRIASLLVKQFPTGSPLVLSMLMGYSQHSMMKFAAADITRSVLQGRRTTFDYACAACAPPMSPGAVPPSMTGAPVAEEGSALDLVYGLQWLFGAPDTFSCALASTTNLACEIDADPLARFEGSLAASYAGRANYILKHIKDYCPSLCPFLRGSGLHNAARTAVQELWRQTALIHYYQALLQLPAEHELLQTCLREFRELIAVIELGLPALLYGSLAFPLFLAATICVTLEDQNELRKRHVALFEVSAFADNHRFLETLWAQSFGQARLKDWRSMPGRSSMCYL